MRGSGDRAGIRRLGHCLSLVLGLFVKPWATRSLTGDCPGKQTRKADSRPEKFEQKKQGQREADLQAVDSFPPGDL